MLSPHSNTKAFLLNTFDEFCIYLKPSFFFFFFVGIRFDVRFFLTPSRFPFDIPWIMHWLCYVSNWVVYLCKLDFHIVLTHFWGEKNRNNKKRESNRIKWAFSLAKCSALGSTKSIKVVLSVTLALRCSFSKFFAWCNSVSVLCFRFCFFFISLALTFALSLCLSPALHVAQTIYM